MQNSSLGLSLNHPGPVHVRLTGVIRGGGDHSQPSSITAPTEAEARAALDRAASVTGADKVVQVASDYRRVAIACGPLSTQTLVEVQAWGTAVQAPEPPPLSEDDAA